MEFRTDARPSPIAGTWYSGEPEKLAIEIDAFMESAKVSCDEFPGRLTGLVAPHAGLRYSGRTAGYAYQLTRDDPRDLAVILSPFHPYTTADFLTTAHSAYQTPLGAVEVDEEALLDLGKRMKEAGLALQQIARDGEHSLEIQLPFLQRAWKREFKLLPVMVRSRDAVQLKRFSQALYTVIQERDFLLIASTDLSHFYPLDYAEVLDAEMLRRIRSMDAEAVLRGEDEGSASACGAGGVAAMLWTAGQAGADKAYIVNYSTSADATGDSTSVVGYGAAAVFSPASLNN